MNILEIPNEIMSMFFMELDNSKDLKNSMLVCTQFKELIESNQVIWKRAFENQHGYQLPKDESYYKTFKARSKLLICLKSFSFSIGANLANFDASIRGVVNQINKSINNSDNEAFEQDDYACAGIINYEIIALKHVNSSNGQTFFDKVKFIDKVSKKTISEFDIPEYSESTLCNDIYFSDRICIIKYPSKISFAPTIKTKSIIS